VLFPAARFSRIQSTACEQQRFEALVMGLDPELLMALAAGRTCLLWDCASRSKGRHGVPRAIWWPPFGCSAVLTMCMADSSLFQ
jgi:hypothetical protein